MLPLSGKVAALALAPSSRQVAVSGNDSPLRVYDVATGRADVTLPGHVAYALMYRPDGKQLAVLD